MSLEPDLFERIKKEYPDEHVATVTALLEACGTDFGGNRGVVQLAILELADGSLDRVKHHVEASKTDFRDVLYWAFGGRSDPRRLLWELRDQLVSDGVISDEDSTSLGLIGSHQGLLRELERLCEMLQRNEHMVTAGQLDTIKKLTRRFRLPARLWESLTTRSD